MVANDHAPIGPGEIGMFLLEIVSLIGIGRLGWQLGDGGRAGMVMACAMVVVACSVWVVFRSRVDEGTRGATIVAIPGPLRLVIEYSVYALGVIGLWVSGWQAAAMVLGVGIVIVTVLLRGRALGLARDGKG